MRQEVASPLEVFFEVTIPLYHHGELNSRARCVPLQYLSSSIRGVKKCPNPNTKPELIAEPNLLQEKKDIAEQVYSDKEKEFQLLNKVFQTESGMFYELLNKNRMECERYQDCSWFQQDLTKESLNSKLLLAETAEPIIDFDEFDLAMPYAKENNILKVQKYPEAFDDILLEKKEKEEEKIKNSNVSADDSLLFTNYKNENEDIFNTYNINYSIRKADSFDNVEFISSTNPAEILPITLMECLNSSKCSQSISNIKNEPKEEAELYSPESNSYLMHSNDSDLSIGREEVIEEVDLNESTDHLKTSESYSEQDGSSSVETFGGNIKSDVTSQQKAISKKPLNSEVQKDNVSSCLSTVFGGGNSDRLSGPIKSETTFSNSNNDQLSLEKDDLNLDLPKVNFEQPISVSSPDLDFMDLVDYINEDMNSNQEIRSKSHSLLNSSSDNLVSNNKTTVQKNSVNSVFDVNTTQSKDFISNSDKGVNETSNSAPPNTAENNPKEDTAAKIDEEHISIAERIKTVAKRKSAKKYNIKNVASSDEDDYSYDTNDDNDEDEDYNYYEESPKRRCIALNKRLKPDISESSSSLKKPKDESETIDSYRERRDKNNEASRRSRQNRKAREQDMFRTLEQEERRNLRLKTEADVLEQQVTSLRQLLLQVVLRKAEAT